jgi:pyridoxine 4-dehydrogenase
MRCSVLHMPADRASNTPAARAGTLRLGGELPVNRLGFGAMRITGDEIWGAPTSPGECRSVLNRAVELGVNFIDTADSYGPEVSEQLIAEALRPYPEDLVIATKGGLTRPRPESWEPDGTPEHLRAACEGSLRRLGIDEIDLYQFHRPDPKVPFEESLGTFVNLRNEGKIRHIGVCNVTVEQLRVAMAMTRISSVQNRYNLLDRGSENVLELCEREGIPFIPWYPLATRELIRLGGPLTELGMRHRATPAQLALVWLLARSPVMLPIPGTASLGHLEENVAAAGIHLSEDQLERLEATVSSAPPRG